MTKEQLNRKLAQLLGHEIDEQGTDAMNRFITAANGVYDGRLKLTNGEWFNPCESWDDIMPIALKMGAVSLDVYAGVRAAAITCMPNNHEARETFVCDVNQKKALTQCCVRVLENQRSEK